MTKAKTTEKNEEFRLYHPVFPGPGSVRKRWTALPLILHGSKALSTAGIPNLRSVHILKLKQVMRSQLRSSHFLGSSECLGLILDEYNGHRKALAAGDTYYIEFLFRFDPECIPVHVYLSRPGQIVTDRKVTAKSRQSIRAFLELNAFCSASTSTDKPSSRARRRERDDRGGARIAS